MWPVAGAKDALIIICHTGRLSGAHLLKKASAVESNPRRSRGKVFDTRRGAAPAKCKCGRLQPALSRQYSPWATTKLRPESGANKIKLSRVNIMNEPAAAPLGARGLRTGLSVIVSCMLARWSLLLLLCCVCSPSVWFGFAFSYIIYSSTSLILETKSSRRGQATTTAHDNVRD
jgi:hypothetical protein